jgi:RNA polymerase sigma-70 factor (ECF subfamily)
MVSPKVAAAVNESRVAVQADDLPRLFLAEIYAYVARRLPSREDAEDATAETFAVAIFQISKLRGQDPRIWLLTIARRRVIDAYRRRKRRPELPLTDMPEPLTEQDSETEAVVEIRSLVMKLPEDQREALMLQYIEGLTQDEIAIVMGRSRAAVNSLLQRARARIFREGKSFFLQEDSI